MLNRTLPAVQEDEARDLLACKATASTPPGLMSDGSSARSGPVGVNGAMTAMTKQDRSSNPHFNHGLHAACPFTRRGARPRPASPALTQILPVDYYDPQPDPSRASQHSQLPPTSICSCASHVADACILHEQSGSICRTCPSQKEISNEKLRPPCSRRSRARATPATHAPSASAAGASWCVQLAPGSLLALPLTTTFCTASCAGSSVPGARLRRRRRSDARNQLCNGLCRVGRQVRGGHHRLGGPRGHERLRAGRWGPCCLLPV
jgi:hypothetical protein